MSNRNADGHGGARPGSGSPAGPDRDPERLCTALRRDGEPCTRYRMEGLEVCQKHGGDAPGARDKAIVARTTAALGLPLVEVRDYPAMVGQHLAQLNDEVDGANRELNQRRYNDMSFVEVEREFADILAARDARLGVIAKLAGSVASLSAAKAMNTAADAGAEFLRSQSFAAVLAVVNEALADYPEARAALADRITALLDNGS